MRREVGKDDGADVFSNEKFLAALAAIHETNSACSQRIWSRALRHFANEANEPLTLIRDVLQEKNTEEVKSFLTTNPYFRPMRPNPEGLFHNSKLR